MKGRVQQGLQKQGHPAPVAPSKKLPVLSAVQSQPKSSANLSTLINDLERVSRLSAAAAEKPVRPNDYVMYQVELLQGAFVSLAETLVNEIDEMRSAVVKAQSEREGWLRSMVSLQQRVTDKLLQLEAEQAKAELALQGARAMMQAQVQQDSERLDQQARALAQQVFDTKCDLQALTNQVSCLELLSSADLPPSSVLQERLLDMGALRNNVAKVVADIAPSHVAAMVERHTPEAVREQVQAVLKDLVERRTEPLFREVGGELQRLAARVEGMAGEMRASTEEVEQLQATCRGLEAMALQLGQQGAPHSGHQHQDAGTQLQQHDEEVQVLRSQVEEVARQHSRYAKSMEEVLRAVVADAGGLARQARAHEAALQQQRLQLGATREALARCTEVFARALGIASPLPPGTLSEPLSPAPPHSPESTSSAWGLSPLPPAAAFG